MPKSKPNVTTKVAKLVRIAQRYTFLFFEHARIKRDRVEAILARPCLKPVQGEGVASRHVLYCWSVHPKDQSVWCGNCRANFQINVETKKAAVRKTQCFGKLLKEAGSFPSEAIRQRFESDPVCRREVTAAWYAYHLILQSTPHAHNFSDKEEDAICTWCRRPRSDVRWNAVKDPRCEARPWQINRAISPGQEKTHEWILAAQKFILSAYRRKKLDGLLLARIHVMYGFRPIEVEDVICKSVAEMLPKYETEMKWLRQL